MELLARRAGLDKALAEFPDDVAAAAEQAGNAMGRMKAPTDPRAEPWPPMRAGAGYDRTSLADRGGAAEAIAARKLSPVELTTALLERSPGSTQGSMFIRLDAEAAMAAARAAEAEIMAGGRAGHCTAFRLASRTSSMSLVCRPPVTRRS